MNQVKTEISLFLFAFLLICHVTAVGGNPSLKPSLFQTRLAWPRGSWNITIFISQVTSLDQVNKKTCNSCVTHVKFVALYYTLPSCLVRWAQISWRWCVHVTNGLYDFVEKSLSSEVASLLRLVAAGLVEVKI